MALIPVQQASLTGIALNYTAASAGGDLVPNEKGDVILHVKNANASVARQVTITSQVLCNQGFAHNVVVSIPANSERVIGPFSPPRFNNAQGQLELAYDNAADITVAAVKV